MRAAYIGVTTLKFNSLISEINSRATRRRTVKKINKKSCNRWVCSTILSPVYSKKASPKNGTGSLKYIKNRKWLENIFN